MRSSHFLSLFAVLLILGLANAAPHAAAQLESAHKLESRTIGHIWSALELFLYRLTHGGQYPPGYGQAPVTSTSTTAALVSILGTPIRWLAGLRKTRFSQNDRGSYLACSFRA